MILSSVITNNRKRVIVTELLSAAGEFERPPIREVERKYLPLFPEQLNKFRLEAMPIEQLYLSHPSEPFSLRLRETLRGGELVYTATLKDRGQNTSEGLDRLEVETVVDSKTYEYYKQLEHVPIKKLRSEPSNDIAIDWYEDGHVHIESEHPSAIETLGVTRDIPQQHLIDITGEKIADNEWRAHIDYRRLHDGAEALVPAPELHPSTIASRIEYHLGRREITIATIAGRSGSGKSTVVAEIQAQLRQRGIDSTVLSSDDYHRGKTWLESYKGGTWTEWDAPIVYDLPALHQDIETLRSGRTIVKREFDFSSEEPVRTGIVEVAPVILIEGIYARDASFESIADLRFDIPTPLATCVGRRLLRDLKERPQFAEPEKSLRYILEQAEPAWRAQLNV